MTSVDAAVESGATTRARARLIDVDVHPVLATNIGAMLEYVPRGWRERLEYLGSTPLSSSPLNYTFLAGRWVVGVNARPATEAPPGSTAESLQGELLDAHGVDVGQLVASEAAAHAQSRSYDLAAILASAFNDLMLERWMDDPRTRYALLVTPADPVAAAAEVRRHGADRRVSSVWIPTTPTRLGDRRLYPIYEAALEHGLPILSHPGGPAGSMSTPALALESRFNGPTQVWPNVASLVARGVFERYPELRVLFAESGFTWLPPLLRRMDAAWRASGGKVAHLERSPSEVVRTHLRFATTPLDDDRDAAELAALIEDPSTCLADVLVFSSNHPRSGPEWPGLRFEALPDATRRRLFAENALTCMRI